MVKVKNEVRLFLDKCEEIKSCKFIMATTKIKDLLKCIVNSSELYGLFREVTQNFNYPEAKSRYLITHSDGYLNKSYLILPEDASDKLAFIFCLLVEFDRDSVNFNSFLQQYYAEDGSYYSSYHAFCNDVICSLQNIVASLFEKELALQEEEEIAPIQKEADVGNPYLASVLTQIDFIIRREIEHVAQTELSQDEKDVGTNMLTELFNAIKKGNFSLISALIQGYRYFSACTNTFSEYFSELTSCISIVLEELCG